MKLLPYGNQGLTVQRKKSGDWLLFHQRTIIYIFNKNSFSRYLKQNVTTKSDKHMLPCFKQYNGMIERKHGRILT